MLPLDAEAGAGERCRVSAFCQKGQSRTGCSRHSSGWPRAKYKGPGCLISSPVCIVLSIEQMGREVMAHESKRLGQLGVGRGQP